MKKINLQAISLFLLSLVVTSCNSSSSKEDMQKDLQEKAHNALKNETKNAPESNSSKADPQNAMSVADAKKFIAAADANKGKEITVSGYPRGTTKAINGEFMLYISDKTGTGLPEENFACNFKEEVKEQVRAHKAGELVKVSGNIAYDNGMVILKNGKLVE